MISAKEATNLTAINTITVLQSLDAVEDAITSAAAHGNTFVVLNQHLIPNEVVSTLIDNGYHLEVRDDNIIVSWDAFPDNGRDEYYGKKAPLFSDDPFSF